MKERHNRTAGLLAMTAVVIIYGVSYLSRAVVGEYLGAFAIVGLQMVIMAVLFTTMNLVGRKSFRVSRRDLPWILASGLFGTTFFHGFTVLSVTSIGATVSSLLFGFAAAFALLIEIGLRRRRATVLGISSIVISVVGIYILMGVKLGDLAGTDLKGYVLCLASVVSWVIYTFLSDRISGDYDRMVILNYQALVGVVTTVPILLIQGVEPAALALPSVWGNILFLGVFNSTLAYFLNLYAIRQIGVTLSNLMLDFLPVVTIVVSLILYGTVPTTNQLVGGLMILVSVFLLERDQSRIPRS